MKPQIVEKIIHSDGTEEDIEPQEVRRVVNEDTAHKMGVMLRAVETNGHGKKADVPGYLVGGKTGTAQVAKTNGRGYEVGKNIGTFVGHAPINDPKFVVLVKMVNPKGVDWAESSAAPTFQKIMKFLLEYAKIQPTEPVAVKK
jgi:stage V sporulation protein D (sporulation-specific penicillin-binding protein)